MYAVQHLVINADIVKMVYEGLNNCKSGTSKKDGYNYVFKYIKSDELPDTYKSANKQPKRVTEEEKRQKQKQCQKNWSKQKYKCPNCGKQLKNGCRYTHNKLYCSKIEYFTTKIQ